ncbi:hypothetical protein AADS55_004215 [Escherichia coli]
MFNNWEQFRCSVKNTLTMIDNMSHDNGYRDYKTIVENSEVYCLLDFSKNNNNFNSHNQHVIYELKEIFEEYENWSPILILISYLMNPEFIISKIIDKISPNTYILNQARTCIINYYIPREFSEHYSERFKTKDLDISTLDSPHEPEVIGRQLSYYNDLLPDIIPNDVRISLYVLSEYNCEMLNDVLSSSINIIKTYCLSSCINMENKIKLVSSSNATHVSKILTFYIFNNTNTNKKNIEINNHHLVKVFETLYKKGEFSYWMKYINTYPCRFPNIQPYLGEALALVNSPEALELYLDSIKPHNNDQDRSYTNSRELVAQCLTIFKQNSTSNLQLYCWNKAFIVWSKWNFGLNTNDLLFSISSSELDYPVIQYFLNNTTEIEREQFIDDIWEKLSSIDNIWHDSQSQLVSYYYRCASTLQLPLHAKLAKEKNDSKVDLFLRFDLDISKYNQMLFGV